MKKKGKKVCKNDEDSEEWCFVCKDGGEVIMCDHRDCIKSYHLDCVDESSAKAKKFICDWHKCDTCRRPSDYQCYCCPKSVCGRCIKSADFVQVKGKKGFCDHCLKLALLVEEKKDVDSDGEIVDFDNRNTYETLYKEYWEIINEVEKLTLDVLITAKAQLKSGKNYDSDKCVDSDEYQCSDSDENEETEPHDSGKKLKRSTPGSSKKKANKKVKPDVKSKSNKEEFTGWGSTRLIEFLTHIEIDTANALSQRDLENIVKRYSKDKDLIQKKKIVECDDWLWSIFKRKTIRMNRIYDSLETHLAENQVSSSDDDDDDDDDDLGYDSEEKVHVHVDEAPVIHKNKKKKTSDKIVEKKEPVVDVSHFRFASIVPENIRLVYLRRSLVQKFEKEPETFENKVIGSFVRAKEDPNGCFSKGSYQLMQITGVKKCLVGENDETFVLQALETEIRISSLSDDEFTEEECQDLKAKVKSGLLKKLELVELEEKARSLHRDIKAHWLPRELALLKHRIDQANEKGWRKEYPFLVYLQRRAFLQKPENQKELLEKVPPVVPDFEEADPDDNKDSPKSILTNMSYGNFKVASEESKPEVPGFEKIELAKELQKLFESAENKSKSRKSSVVKNPSQLFESSEGKPTIALSKEELDDTENFQWYLTSSSGDKVGPVSLMALKNWSQNLGASELKIYKMGQTEEHAKPLIDVLHLAFPKM
ncbi:zinc ion binding protein [Tanacetum coccineum]